MLEKLKKTWKELDQTVPVNMRELTLGIAACTLAGVVLGMLFSPRKNQTIGSNNCIRNGGHVTSLPEAPEDPDAEEA